MPDYVTSPLPTGEASDLETALEQAHSHARLYGLWEVADDLGRILQEIQARDEPASIPPLACSRGPVRRRP